jgi:rhodanese-related sulfurtransferase
MKIILCLLVTLTTASVTAGTPVQLDTLMKSGTPVTIIDLRSTEAYQQGHIPGAINIPHRLIAEKKLPPLGRVVAYCDGLGSTYTGECVAALNARPNIQAEALEGGYAAWQTFTNVTAEASSVRKETPRTITYADLEATKGQGVVIVDARREPAAIASTTGEAPVEKLNLAAFRQESVPAATVTSDAFGQLSRLRSGGARFVRAPSLLVVIDNDNASAMETALRIQQSGYKRVVVLAGGEEIIRRKGKPGLSRQGAAAPVALDPALKPQPLKQQ